MFRRTALIFGRCTQDCLRSRCIRSHHLAKIQEQFTANVNTKQFKVLANLKNKGIDQDQSFQHDGRPNPKTLEDGSVGVIHVQNESANLANPMIRRFLHDLEFQQAQRIEELEEETKNDQDNVGSQTKQITMSAGDEDKDAKEKCKEKKKEKSAKKDKAKKGKGKKGKKEKCEEKDPCKKEDQCKKKDKKKGMSKKCKELAEKEMCRKLAKEEAKKKQLKKCKEMAQKEKCKKMMKEKSKKGKGKGKKGKGKGKKGKGKAKGKKGKGKKGKGKKSGKKSKKSSDEDDC